MRRVWRANTDLRVEIAKPTATQEKFEIFVRYLDHQHDNEMSRSYDCFEHFLYDSPTETQEFVYWLGDRLVGVSILDSCPGGLSSVFTYFEADFAKRSIGTYTALWEIEHCRRLGLPYYYLGYFVAGSKTMAYKSRFRPYDLLVGNDRWVTLSV
jgi:arginine-tRNA-protein transferase